MSLMSQVKIVDFVLKVLSGEVRKYSEKVSFKKNPYVPHEIKAPLLRAFAEDEGISSDRLREFYLELSGKRDVNPQGVIVMRHGKIISEGYWAPFFGEYAHTTYSLCKSVTALAIACLMDEGKLSSDTKVLDIFQEYDSLFTPPGKRQLTVEHLLTMSSGIAFSEIGSFIEDEWLKSSLSELQRFSPGEKFEYNSINSYILSAIVERVSGKNMLEYLNERLFKYMGIGNLSWEKCPNGIEKGGWGLTIRLEDLAKLGQLYLGRGLYNGKRLIGEAYFDLALKPHKRVDDDTGYGYHIWVLDELKGYSFNGLFGQYVIVLPKQDMVVAVFAASENLFTDGRTLSLVKKYFVDVPVSDLPLKRNRLSAKVLYQTLSQLKYRDVSLARKRLFWIKNKSPISSELLNFLAPYLDREFECDIQGGFLPFVLQLSHSNYESDVKSFKFTRHMSGILLTLNQETGVSEVVFGLDEAKKNIIDFRGEIHTVYAQAKMKYTEDDVPVLVCDLSFVETPHSRIIKFYFEDEDEIKLKFAELPAVWPALENLEFTENLPAPVRNRLKNMLEPETVCRMETEL